MFFENLAPDQNLRANHIPLGNIPKFASTAEIIEESHQDKIFCSLKTRYFLAYRQRKILRAYGAGFPSLVACSSVPVPAKVKKKDGSLVDTGAPGYVQVMRYGRNEVGSKFNDCDIPYGYAWVKHCSSPLLCFICAPKIHFKRSQEIELGCNIMFNKGYRWLFVTFTAPHDLNDNPDKQIKNFQNASRKLHSGSWWVKFCEKWGYKGQIKATELTDDNPSSKNKSGCHWHHHVIMFFDKDKISTPDSILILSDELQKRWAEAIIKEGICDCDKFDDLYFYGCKVVFPDSHKDIGIQASKYASKGAALEISPAIFSKNGRLPDRISHWELMALAFTVRPDLIPRAILVMQALKGRSWLRWSPGLKKFCGIGEKSDEDLLHDEGSEVVFNFDENERVKNGITWSGIDKYKMQREVLEETNKAVLVGCLFNEAIRFFGKMVCEGFDPCDSEFRCLSETRSVDNYNFVGG